MSDYEIGHAIGDVIGALLGSFIAFGLWLLLTTALLNLVAFRRSTPELRAGWIVGGVYILSNIPSLFSGNWVFALFTIPPTVVAWLVYRSFLRRRASAAPTGLGMQR